MSATQFKMKKNKCKTIGCRTTYLSYALYCAVDVLWQLHSLSTCWYSAKCLTSGVISAWKYWSWESGVEISVRKWLFLVNLSFQLQYASSFHLWVSRFGHAVVSSNQSLLPKTSVMVYTFWRRIWLQQFWFLVSLLEIFKCHIFFEERAAREIGWEFHEVSRIA